jgi:hypothetical protein
MIAIQKAGELPKPMFPTGRRATIQPVLTAVAAVFLILPSHAAVADTGWQNLDGVSAVKVLPQGVEVEAGAVRDRVTALSSNVVCVRYAPRSVSGGTVFRRAAEDEHYFGLGDKAGPLDRRNMASPSGILMPSAGRNLPIQSTKAPVSARDAQWQRMRPRFLKFPEWSALPR